MKNEKAAKSNRVTAEMIETWEDMEAEHINNANKIFQNGYIPNNMIKIILVAIVKNPETTKSEKH